MSSNCRSANPATCRYHGHADNVAAITEQQREAEKKGDFDAYAKATDLLKFIENKNNLFDEREAAAAEARDNKDYDRANRLRDAKIIVSSNGTEFVRSIDKQVDNGSWAPPYVCADHAGERFAYARADIYKGDYKHQHLRFQASAPLSESEMIQVKNSISEYANEVLKNPSTEQRAYRDSKAGAFIQLGGLARAKQKEVDVFNKGVAEHVRTTSPHKNISITLYYLIPESSSAR